MVVDSSAALAILLQEPEAEVFAAAIEAAPAPLISAATLVEVGAVLLARQTREARQDLADFPQRVRPASRTRQPRAGGSRT